MGCKCAPACKKALDDATLRWPKRNRASDGCCGDAAHAKRKSDHNPNAQGYALAFDLTHDPKNGPDCEELSLEVIYDPRITYVIWNSQIYKARTKKWEAYRGANKHEKHMHVSIKTEATKDLSPWPWSPEVERQTKPIENGIVTGDSGEEQKVEPPAATQTEPKPEVLPVEAPKGSIMTKVAAAAGAAGPVLGATGLKIGGVEFKTGGLIAFAAVVIVGMIIAAVLYNEDRKRAFERQKMSIDNLADKGRRNVIAAGSKV